MLFLPILAFVIYFVHIYMCMYILAIITFLGLQLQAAYPATKVQKSMYNNRGVPKQCVVNSYTFKPNASVVMKPGENILELMYLKNMQ